MGAVPEYTIRYILSGNGLDADKQMKYGVPFVIARAILIIVLGYAFLKLWPMFGQLSYL